jgi:hypothetical protein
VCSLIAAMSHAVTHPRTAHGYMRYTKADVPCLVQPSLHTKKVDRVACYCMPLSALCCGCTCIPLLCCDILWAVPYCAVPWCAAEATRNLVTCWEFDCQPAKKHRARVQDMGNWEVKARVCLHFTHAPFQSRSTNTVAACMCEPVHKAALGIFCSVGPLIIHRSPQTPQCQRKPSLVL